MTGFHTEPGSAAERRLFLRLKDDRRRIDGDGRNHCAAAPAKVAKPRILCRHHRAEQRHSVADAEREHDVRRRKEHPAHLRALSVCRRVEEHYQQHGEADIHGHQPCKPGLLAFLHPDKEEKGNQSDQQIGEVEFLHRAAQQHSHLVHETTQAAGGVGSLILAARQRMKKTLPGARITPVQRRIGHRSQRHIEIKRRAKHP